MTELSKQKESRNFFFIMGAFVALIFPTLIEAHQIPLELASLLVMLGFGIAGISLIVLSINIDKTIKSMETSN